MKAINNILILFLGLFVLTYPGLGQQSLFNINNVDSDGKVRIRLPLDSTSTIIVSQKQVFHELMNLGYFDAKIDTSYQSNDSIVFEINTGIRYRISEIILTSESNTQKIAQNQLFDVLYIGKIIQEQLTLDEQNSYPFSSIRIDSLDIKANQQVVVHLFQELGEFVEIKRLIFSGNSQLSSEYLNKMARFNDKRPYSPANISRIESIFRNSIFFRNVTPAGIIKDSDQYFYGFEVTESRASSLDLILGYEPDAVSGNKFVGNGNLRLANLFSEGSIMQLEFQKLTDSNSRLLLGYDQYWFNRIPLSAGLYFNFSQRDSTYQKINTQAHTTIQLNDILSLSGFVGYQSTRGVNRELNNLARNNNETTVGFSVDLMDLDRRISPKNGYKVSFGASIGQKNLNVDNTLHPSYRRNYPKQMLNISTRVYKQLSDPFVIAFSAQSGFLKMDQFYEDDLFVFGGTKSLRGYREEQFRSRFFAWGDAEIRYLLDETSYFFIFGAYGAHQHPQNFVQNNQLMTTTRLYSGGFGLNYEVRLGLLKITYAVGSQDQITNGKIHFGITNFF